MLSASAGVFDGVGSPWGEADRGGSRGTGGAQRHPSAATCSRSKNTSENDPLSIDRCSVGMVYAAAKCNVMMNRMLWFLTGAAVCLGLVDAKIVPGKGFDRFITI